MCLGFFKSGYCPCHRRRKKKVRSLSLSATNRGSSPTVYESGKDWRCVLLPQDYHGINSVWIWWQRNLQYRRCIDGIARGIQPFSPLFTIYINRRVRTIWRPRTFCHRCIEADMKKYQRQKVPDDFGYEHTRPNHHRRKRLPTAECSCFGHTPPLPIVTLRP